uniref:MYB transcription factor n=1 Tax=Kalanchoe fedtschenkoi TaxID=63787 RepID=A0A7N0V980_KALFE
MGNPKLKWTAEEEEALLSGIARHGAGKWKNILTDPEFAPVFSKRTNIDLKDKWRNLTVSSTGHHGMKDKTRIPKLKSLMASTSSNAQRNESLAVVPHETPLDVVMEDAPNGTHEPKNAPKYNDMIFEAISAAKDAKGLDINAIITFIEKKQEVPPNFRRLLSSKLRRLVTQGKLDKVQNCYIIKKDMLPLSLPESKTSLAPAQKETRLQHPRTNGHAMVDTAMEEASISAAYKIADAENKSFLASEAVKESERVMKMCEDTECLLQIAKEIHERCSQGKIVLLA